MNMSRMNQLAPLLMYLLLIICSSNTVANDAVDINSLINNLGHEHEKLLIEALDQISQGDIDEALTKIKVVVDANPNFRLAQLMYADLLLSKSRPIQDFGNFHSATYESITALRDEMLARIKHYRLQPSENKLPASLVMLGEQQKHVVVLDMNASRLYLYGNKGGVPMLINDFYASIGKNGTGKFTEGDQKTPIGVYFVTGFINPEKLPDLYGDGAYPIDYPNVWDRRHGRTGYGIWLHGTPSTTFSRPPRDSDGCIILSNKDLQILSPILKSDEVPVVLTEDIHWLDKKEWQTRQGEYASLVEKWRRDWESRDADLYLGHYSPTYTGLGMDYATWVNYKKRVNPSKEYIKIGITDESIYLYPGEEGLLVITFKQKYESDNHQRYFIKRQYWRMENDGKWRIIYEGSVS